VARPRRAGAVFLVAALLQLPAAGAFAQAARPFPELPVTETPQRSHAWAYATLAAGVVLVAGSFPLANHADDLYDQYLQATDPREIEDLYDRTTRYDWYARGTLIGGEVLVATGLYLRFIRQPRTSRTGSTLGLVVGPNRCALAVRF
jgi:hypothetical protein